MTVWCVTILIVVAAATIQTVTGFGFSLAALPVFTLLYGTRDGIVVNLLLSATTNLWVSWRNRSDAVPDLVRPLVAGGLAGLVPGLLVFHFASGQVLRLGIGAMLVVAVALRLSGRGITVRLSPAASVVTGGLSGFLQGSIGLGGPPVSLYLSGSGIGKAAYRGTAAVFFVLPNAVNLPAHLVGLSGDEWTRIGLACTAALFIPIGNLIGQAAFTRIRQAAFERIVLAVILFAAAVAVYQGIADRPESANPSPARPSGASVTLRGAVSDISE